MSLEILYKINENFKKFWMNLVENFWGWMKIHKDSKPHFGEIRRKFGGEIEEKCLR